MPNILRLGSERSRVCSRPLARSGLEWWAVQMKFIKNLQFNKAAAETNRSAGMRRSLRSRSCPSARSAPPNKAASPDEACVKPPAFRPPYPVSAAFGHKMKLKRQIGIVVAVLAFSIFASSCGDKAPQEQKVVRWPEAVAFIRSGELLSGAQDHDRTVHLEMKDGRRYRTTEPNLDDVYKILKEIYPKGYPPAGFPTE